MVAAGGTSLFLPMRNSAQLNGAIVFLDNAASNQSATNLAYQNVWRNGKQTLNGSTDDEGSRSDEEHLNYISNPSYSQTINRVQGISQAI